MKVVKNVHSECWQLGNKLHGVTSQINTNPHDNLKSVILIAIPHLTSIHIHQDDNVNDSARNCRHWKTGIIINIHTWLHNMESTQCWSTQLHLLHTCINNLGLYKMHTRELTLTFGMKHSEVNTPVLQLFCHTPASKNVTVFTLHHTQFRCLNYVVTSCNVGLVSCGHMEQQNSL